MPIIVNIPGGKLDTAGRGVAAAQQFRQGEQRMEALDTEMDLATRRVELAENEIEFEREQLAVQQEAEADLLMAQAIDAGIDIGDGGAYHAALAQASPEMRQRLAYEFGRSSRLLKEQQDLDEVLSELEATPKTQARVQSGELNSVASIKSAAARERREIAHAAFQEQSRLSAIEKWQTWTKDPGYDMPDEDDEAYEDVMDILGELADGSVTNSKLNYNKLSEQLIFLTSKARHTARELLQRDLGGVDVRGLPKGTIRGATSNEDFQVRAIEEYTEERGRKDQAKRNADDPGYEARKQRARAASSGEQADSAVVAPKPQTSAEISARNVIPPVPEDKAEIAQEALKNLGMKRVPDDGTSEFAMFVAEVKRIERERMKKLEKKTQDPYGGISERLRVQ